MTPLHGEYRVRQHPDLPEKALITWRPDHCSAVWTVVSEDVDNDDCLGQSEAMCRHRDHGAHQ